MESVPSETFKAALVLKQPEISHLVRELRQLMQLTQVQLAAALGVAYGLTHSSSQALRDGSEVLLNKYFSREEDL